ncbi:DnaJ domain-containing protein [Novosphingobium arvoryzae]|uniref:J domain-containing protein n=1 Tax=Novosphingobium arvoryzae TaxID=1256514 RepID=A0A918RDC4_9SPHN|nr:J domain-containing protein [Novosphingobium arvoryzae]GGZ94089.1 hypothetical protein GCM10011617_12690 [Novosphingobium arvoryzae]
MSEKSLYQILGVSPDASQAEIRTAYLRLAKEWHPDRNPDNEAEAERRFKEIAHAYDVLSDPDKRAAYDAAAGTGDHTAGFEGTMDEDAAFDLFISVLLDLAFELAENGADQITIYQALIDMGCPSGTAKTLAQRAHKLGGNGKVASSTGEAENANQYEVFNPTIKSDERLWALWLIPFALLGIMLFVISVADESTEPEAEASEVAVEVVENGQDAPLAVEPTQSDVVNQNPPINSPQSYPPQITAENLDRDERLSLQLACMNAQMQGPAAYNQCVQQQISQISPSNRHPEKSQLDRDQQLSLQLACMNAQMQGPEAYNQCVNYQLSLIGR